MAAKKPSKKTAEGKSNEWCEQVVEVENPSKEHRIIGLEFVIRTSCYSDDEAAVLIDEISQATAVYNGKLTAVVEFVDDDDMYSLLL